ncbi:DUF4245 domain-containing protein [Actinomadura atramentaria]|uniref:DUF4245 domain-containing protein n=1 Tax=Actinomadura atramentaria TaxID=1990 RepID=UPI000381EDCB|nr:DUF4245 domain-containing protein [Actinomadura atramentaria]
MSDTTQTPAPESPAAPRSAAGRPVVEVSPGVHKRLTTGLGGFTIALAACFALVAVIYFITPRGDKEVLPTVDYAGHLLAMRSGAPYTPQAPEGLPARWRPTSSRVNGLGSSGQPVAWHLGFVTPSDEYAALEQSDEKPAAYIPRMTNSKNPTGTREIAGATWQTYYRKDKKAYSLARTLPGGPTVVVTGTAGYDELAVLVTALRPQPKP